MPTTALLGSKVSRTHAVTGLSISRHPDRAGEGEGAVERAGGKQSLKQYPRRPLPLLAGVRPLFFLCEKQMWFVPRFTRVSQACSVELDGRVGRVKAVVCGDYPCLVV